MDAVQGKLLCYEKMTDNWWNLCIHSDNCVSTAIVYLNAIDWESFLKPFSHDPSKIASVFQELFDLSLHAPIQKQKEKLNMLRGSAHT